MHPERSGPPPDTQTEERGVEAVAAQITEISTLPSVALRVMETAGDPSSGAADLKAIVEADPTLCVRVLRCVNSASFGLRNPIEDLNQAVSYLGFNQIRDLAVTASVSDLFRGTDAIGTYRRSGLWEHLVAVGVASRMIAVRRAIDGFENAFLSGLLHDVGIILFDQNRHDEFRHVLQRLTSEKTLAEVERAVTGWDHTELGAAVGARWKLPPTTLAAMRFHHTPAEFDGPDALIVHCVAIANVLCSVKEMTSIGRNLVVLPHESLEILGLERTDLNVLAEDLDAEIARHQHLFDIQKG